MLGSATTGGTGVDISFRALDKLKEVQDIFGTRLVCGMYLCGLAVKRTWR